VSVVCLASLGVLHAGIGVADIATSESVKTPGASLDEGVADELIVRKSERKLYLLRAGEVLRSYSIALGANPEGPKQREGDRRTPEGTYRIDWRKPDSDFYLALHISYPNDADLRRASREGADPGGMIMIHGLPNDPKHPRRDYLISDWTDGCIAVSNAAMIDLWMSVPDDTPITILP
jgi:murein L,D-transpeptidase YafK